MWIRILENGDKPHLHNQFIHQHCNQRGWANCREDGRQSKCHWSAPLDARAWLACLSGGLHFVAMPSQPEIRLSDSRQDIPLLNFLSN
jgi:hypothetical protein